MACELMTVHEAAKTLHERLEGEPWLTAVGVGKEEGRDCIFVYVTAARPELLAHIGSEWWGYPVVVRRMTFPRPLSIHP
jgi:hypothetical protein